MMDYESYKVSILGFYCLQFQLEQLSMNQSYGIKVLKVRNNGEIIYLVKQNYNRCVCLCDLR